MSDYCLDSWAVLAWLEGVEPAAARVQEVPETGTPVMSWINAGEVYFVVHRRASRAAALDVLAELRRRTMLELPSEARVLQAAAIKAIRRSWLALRDGRPRISASTPERRRTPASWSAHVDRGRLGSLGAWRSRGSCSSTSPPG